MTRRHSSTWGCTFVLPPPPKHGTFCSCGIFECDRMGAYCDKLVTVTVKRRDETAEALLAAFDRMAAGHRAAARARAERKGPQCAETVGKGTEVRQCSFDALPGSAYCGRHPARPSSSDDFESAPAGLEDAPDQLPF